MYQVTIFNAKGAIVTIEQFSHHEAALKYMIGAAIRPDMLNRNPGYTWQLSQRTGKMGLVPSLKDGV
jgi:hypothetical protein